MSISHEQFIKIINVYKTSTVSTDIKWRKTSPDFEHFDKCTDKLLDLGIGSVMDLGCGDGGFIIKTMERGISSFGIEPRSNEDGINKEPYIARASFESVIEYAKQYPENIPIFDCIVINNTMHGMQKKSGLDLTVQGLFNFFIKYANYIVITEPQWATWDDSGKDLKKKCQFPDKFELIHEFEGSYGGNAFHKLYKVLK